MDKVTTDTPYGAIELRGTAAQIAYAMCAIGQRDALVAALQWVEEHSREFGDIEDAETMCAKMEQRARAALAKVVQSTHTVGVL